MNYSAYPTSLGETLIIHPQRAYNMPQHEAAPKTHAYGYREWSISPYVIVIPKKK